MRPRDSYGGSRRGFGDLRVIERGMPSVPGASSLPRLPGPVDRIGATNKLADVKKQWNEASLRGDRAAMDALHSQADQLRAQGADERTALSIAPPPSLPAASQPPAVPSVYGGAVGAGRELAARAAGGSAVPVVPLGPVAPGPAAASAYGGAVNAAREMAQRAAGGAPTQPGTTQAPVYPLGPTPSVGELRRLDATYTSPPTSQAPPAALPPAAVAPVGQAPPPGSAAAPPAALPPSAQQPPAAAAPSPVAAPPPAAVPPPAAQPQTQPDWQKVVTDTNTSFAKTVETINQGYTDLVNYARNDTGTQAMIANWMEQAVAQLNTLEQSVAKRFQDQMGQADPSVTAALAVIRDEVDLQRKALLEDLNAKGLAQSGIMVEMQLRMNKNQLTAEQQLVANRLSDLTNQLNQAIMNFANARVNLMSQGIGLRASAQENQFNRVVQANEAALGAQTQLAGMGLEQQRFAANLGFQAGENTAQRQFTAGQNELQRGWQGGQNELQRTFEGQQNAARLGTEQGMNAARIGLQERLTNAEIASRENIAQWSNASDLAKIREEYTQRGNLLARQPEQAMAQVEQYTRSIGEQLQSRRITLRDAEAQVLQLPVDPTVKQMIVNNLHVLGTVGFNVPVNVPTGVPSVPMGGKFAMPYMRNP